MATKNPIGKIVGTAVGALTDPLGTAGKVVEQARGTAALGKMVAEQVGRSAVAKVAGAAGLTGGAEPPDEGRSANLRAVPEVNEPAHTVGRGPVAVRQEEPAKKQGDAVARDLNATGQETDDRTPTMQRTASGSGMSTAKKVPARKAPAEKAPVKKAPVKKAVAGEPVKKVTTRAPANKVAATPPGKRAPAAKKTPAKKVAAPSTGAGEVPTPADVAKVAKKSPAKRAAKKSPPKTARQVANIEGEDVGTPAGTPGASKGFNPDTADTGLQQPGTEPLMDPATVKAAKSAMETAQKAADPDKG